MRLSSGQRYLLTQMPFWALISLIIFCALGGGASRSDVSSLIYLRPAAVICIAILLLSPVRRDFKLVRWPMTLLGLLGLVILIQLIPLPPEIWGSLPGREHYREADIAMGLGQLWRPLSLVPDLTLNSLLALLFPFAGLLGFAALTPDQRLRLLPVLIIIACVSALLGVVQVTSGSGSILFFYNITNDGSAVGLFANRNHQAALIAMTFPMLRIWTLTPHPDPHYRGLRLWVALAIGALLIPLLLITGSRAGLFLTAISLVCTYFLSPIVTRKGRGMFRYAALLLLVPLILAAIMSWFGRDAAVQRLISPEILAAEARLEYLPISLRMAVEAFPAGTGFGTFDPVYRGVEADQALSPSYLNHAHNDLLELAITGGLAGLILLTAFLGWWIVSATAALRWRAPGVEVYHARLGAVMILILLVASLVDYPLRTPLMSLILAIACGWLSVARKGSSRSESAVTPA